jgi:hypothetical protein
MFRKNKTMPLATAVVVAVVAYAGVSATAAAGARDTLMQHATSGAGPREATAQGDAVVSSNWAGYVTSGTDTATATAFSSVSARWVQPRTTCLPGSTSYSAFWIGIGGFSDTSQALEQIGTSANCKLTGAAVYSMWYELVPAASVPIKFKVFPGNVITASVQVVGTKVSLEIRNLTRRTRLTKVLHPALVDVSSAEWVAEAPSSCRPSGSCFVLPLANFGSVSFTNAAATADGYSGAISDPAWTTTPVELVSGVSGPSPDAASQTSIGAVPSALSSDGTAFAIDWEPAVPIGGTAGSGQSNRR